MKLVRWSFYNVQMPMMEADDGRLFCTSSALCKALGVSDDAIRMTYQRYPQNFEGLSVTNCYAKEFFQENKEIFGIQRVRGDMHLWSEQDMVAFSMLSRSEISIEFRTQLNQLIRENARRDYVSKEQYAALEEELAKTIQAKSVMQEEFENVNSRLAKLESLFELAVHIP